MVKKLAIRSLRRGIGSMDYIDTLLTMEDDLDEDDQDEERLREFGKSSDDYPLNIRTDPSPSQSLPTHHYKTPMLHQSLHLLGLCQTGAHVENVDQWHKRSKISVASKRNA